MSKEYIKYIKKIKKYKFMVIFTQIAILILFLFIWQICANKNIINSFITSSPIKIFYTIINLINKKMLFNNILITIYETIISFSLGTIIGIIIASILWYFVFLSDVIDPYLTIINSLPKVALGPIIIIWAGAGIKSIIIMALLISTVITIINILEGFSKTDKNKIKLMKTFNASKTQIFMKLVFPSNYPVIISTLKINISMSLVGLLPPVGEKTFFNKCYSRY